MSLREKVFLSITNTDTNSWKRFFIAWYSSDIFAGPQPRSVSDHEQFVELFWIFFAIEANSSNHFRAQARPQPDLSQTSARFELNWIELSLTLLLLLSRQRAREASAFIKNNKRRPLWEPLGSVHSQLFSSGGSPFFEEIFGRLFFWKMVPNGASNGFKNVTKSDKNRTWNEGNKTC